MRDPWTILACATIGFAGVVGYPAQARQFDAVVIPMNPGAVGAGPGLAAVSSSVATVSAPSRKRSHPAYALPALARYVGADGVLDPVRRGLRSRGSGMFDVYAAGASGLRVSGGSHYQMHYEATEGGTLSGTGATMQVPGGAVALRDGYERYAPVAMVGYDAPMGDRVKVGVEGGMMVGRATAMFGTSSLANEMNVSRTASNPVADVVMTVAF